MTQSGLADNNSGDTFSICQGATIFGLTSSTGTSTIKHIGFHATLDDIEEAVSIQQIQPTASSPHAYTLSGMPAAQMQPNHIYIINGKKVIAKE